MIEGFPIEVMRMNAYLGETRSGRVTITTDSGKIFVLDNASVKSIKTHPDGPVKIVITSGQRFRDCALKVVHG